MTRDVIQNSHPAWGGSVFRCDSYLDYMACRRGGLVVGEHRVCGSTACRWVLYRRSGSSKVMSSGMTNGAANPYPEGIGRNMAEAAMERRLAALEEQIAMPALSMVRKMLVEEDRRHQSELEAIYGLLLDWYPPTFRVWPNYENGGKWVVHMTANHEASVPEFRKQSPLATELLTQADLEGDEEVEALISELEETMTGLRTRLQRGAR